MGGQRRKRPRFAKRPGNAFATLDALRDRDDFPRDVAETLAAVATSDPDGYRIEFSSPTDAPEESEWEE